MNETKILSESGRSDFGCEHHHVKNHEGVQVLQVLSPNKFLRPELPYASDTHCNSYKLLQDNASCCKAP